MSADALGKWIAGIVATILVLALASYIGTTNRQLDLIDQRLDALTERQGEVREQLRGIDGVVHEVPARVSDLRREIAALATRLGTLETQSVVLTDHLRRLEQAPPEGGP